MVFMRLNYKVMDRKWAKCIPNVWHAVMDRKWAKCILNVWHVVMDKKWAKCILKLLLCNIWALKHSVWSKSQGIYYISRPIRILLLIVLDKSIFSGK